MKFSNKKLFKKILTINIILGVFMASEISLAVKKTDIGVSSTESVGTQKRVKKYNGFSALVSDRRNFPIDGIIYTKKDKAWTVKNGTYWIVPSIEEGDPKDFMTDDKGKKYPLALVSAGVGIVELIPVEIFQEVINRKMSYDVTTQAKQEDEYIKGLSYYLQHNKFMD